MAEMSNPLNERQRKRLRAAAAYSRQKLEPFRRNNFESLCQYVGSHYGDGGAADRVPVNLIQLATAIYLRTLAARSPQVMVSSPYRMLKPSAAKLELGMNHLLREIKFRDTIRMGVLNALYSIGIFKTGICAYGKVEIEGVHHDVGQPFCDVVHLDDWVHDCSARTFEEVAYCGNRYRLPKDAVMDNPIYTFDRDVQVTPSAQSGMENGTAKAESLTQGQESGGETFHEMIELWDYFLPQENLIVTLLADNEDAAPIRVVDWEGPENGPFHLLSFSDVPNNIMPSPPVNAWRDIHELSNDLFRKLGRQASRQKTILGVQGGADADGNRIVNASDGDVMRVDSPDKAKEYRFGGIDQQNLLFFLQCKDIFSYIGGNLDTLGGLSPMADTAKQEELLVNSSNKQTADMQDQVMTLVERVCGDLGWWLWTDPLIELPLIQRVQGTDIEIPVTFSAEAREGDFLDYNFKIKPYSMAHDSPGQRLQALTQVWTQWIMPNLQFMQQLGIEPDWEALLRLVAKYTNNDDLEEILKFGGPPTMPRPEPIGQPEKGSAGPAKPAQTTRTYERISRPGASRAGKDAAMSAMLMGQNPQPKEMAGMMRQVG